MANKNRDKGHRAERYFAEEFRKLGYTKCVTSRVASRLLDDSKVDLAFTPGVNIQIKAGLQKTMRPAKVLHEMEVALKANFPEEDPISTYPGIVIHRKQGATGKKRTPEMDLVYFYQKKCTHLLSRNDFLYFLENMIKLENGIMCCTWETFVKCFKLKK